jgi:hypothetical protein
MSEQQDFRKLGYVGSLNPVVDRNDWFTPAKYIEAARVVLGEIEFDPYSDPVANETVKALKIRTKLDNSNSPWPDVRTVWMNPPYQRGMVEKAVFEFIGEQDRQNFQGIILVNNATETRWCQALMKNAHAACFTDHRIAFNQVDGKAVSGNTRGQIFFYFGGPFGLSQFYREFGQFGYTV